MKRDIEKLILRIYSKLPKRLQKNHHVCALVQPIAERWLRETVLAVNQAKWQRYRLEQELQKYKE